MIASIPVELSTAKKATVKTTITIPTSLSQTKKLVEEKAKQSVEPKVVLTQENVEVKPSKSSVVLTQQLLDAHIFSIQEHFRNADKKFELAILDQPIEVRSGGEIALKVAGSVQEEIANKMKPELLGLIRKLTNASQLSIAVEQAEEVLSDKPNLYTNSDKLRYLRDKHPALAELQRKFGLDVDF